MPIAWEEFEAVGTDVADETDWSEFELAEEPKPTAPLRQEPISGPLIKPVDNRDIFARGTEASTIYGGPPKELPGVPFRAMMPDIVEAATTPSIPLAKFQVNKDDSVPMAVGKSVANILIGIPEFISSPVGAGITALAPVAPTAVAAGFSLDMLKSLGEQVYSSIKNWKEMSNAERAAAVTDMAGTGVFAWLTGAHALKGFRGTPGEFQGPIATGEVLRMPEGAKPPPVAEIAKSEQAAREVSETAAEPVQAVTPEPPLGGEVVTATPVGRVAEAKPTLPQPATGPAETGVTLVPSGTELHHGAIKKYYEQIISSGKLIPGKEVRTGTTDELGLIWTSPDKELAGWYSRGMGETKDIAQTERGGVVTVQIPTDLRLIDRSKVLTENEAKIMGLFNGARQRYDPVEPGMDFSKAVGKILQNSRLEYPFMPKMLKEMGYDGISYAKGKQFGIVADELKIKQTQVPADSAAPVTEVKPAAAAIGDFNPGTRRLVHGGTGKFEKGKPIFFTKEQGDAEWYAGERGGESPQLVEADVTINNPASAKDILDAAKKVKATQNDIAKFSNQPNYVNWQIESPIDYVYVPKVVAELKRRGFDGAIVSDPLENTEIMAYVPFETSQIKEVSRKLGKRVPEVSGDFVYSDFKPTTPTPETTAPAQTKAVAKVQKEIKNVADTEGQRPAQDVKAELVKRLEDQLDSLVETSGIKMVKDAEQSEWNKGVDSYKITNNNGDSGFVDIELQKSGKWRASYNSWRGRDYLDAKTAEDAIRQVQRLHGSGPGKVTIEIPGDGEFTVFEDGKALTELLRRANRINTEPSGAKRPSQTNYQKDRSIGKKPIQTQELSGQGNADTAIELYGSAARAVDILQRQLDTNRQWLEPKQIAATERLIDYLKEQSPQPEVDAKPVNKLKRKEMVDELHSYGIKETFTGGYVKNLRSAELKALLVKERAKRQQSPPAAPGENIIGMGGAVPSELRPSASTPTSIKNAVVDQERAVRGLPPAIQPARRQFGESWDMAMAKMDQDPTWQDRLVTELRNNPRALTDVEDAAILHRQIDLQNEYGKATRDLAQAFDDGRMDAVADINARVAEVSDQLLDIYNTGKRVGTATGRGLAARKMMAYEDFSLAKMELEKRAGKGGEHLTDSERAEVIRLHNRIAETQKAYDDYVAKSEAKIAEIEFNRAMLELKAKNAPTFDKRVLRAAENIVVRLEKAAEPAANRLRERLARMGTSPDPTLIYDAAVVGSARIARLGLDLAKFTDSMVTDFSDKIRPFIPEIWKQANAMLDTLKIPDPVKRVLRKTDLAETKAQVAGAVKETVEAGDLSKITFSIQKLARSLIENGITEREALIDEVHAVLQDVIPEITRREAMDAISGYGQFKQLKKDYISVKLREMKGEMQQLAKLEDMAANQPPLKTGVERRIPSDAERRLIKEVNDAKNKFQIPVQNPETQLRSALDTIKATLDHRTKDYQDRLARGDFEKKPKRIVQMDSEANRLHFEMTKAKAAWHEAMMKDRLAKRSIPMKILGGAGEVLNTSRAIITSADLSAVLRQGGFIALAHPIRAAKAFPAMFKAMRSEAGQHAVNEQIMARENYPLYNQSKLYLSEHGHKLSQMEEAYMSRWADKIPIVAASQRAYVTFLNKLRADSFDAMAKSLSRNRELTPNEGKAIANFINVATGRGSLGAKDNALVGLNTIFFAPRYVASRFQLIAGQPMYRGTARTRIAVAKEYGRFLIGVAMVYALAQMDGATVESDPRSSDFGKLRYGNTRLDPMAGLLQSTVLLSRLGTGETKTATGRIYPIRGNVPYGKENAADVMARFARSKLSPALGTAVNIASGTDVVGKPVTPESVAKSLLVPLSLQDIYKTMIEQGVPRGTAMTLLSIFGMGLQTYDEQQKR